MSLMQGDAAPQRSWDLSLYEQHRKPHEAITDDTEIVISPRSLHNELMCPICLDILKQTMTTKECLHRFCSECIVTALRAGNKECPTCRKKLISKRSLRPDPNFDNLIAKIYPTRQEYEAHQERVLAKLSKHHNAAAFAQSIEEGLRLQATSRTQRRSKVQPRNSDAGGASAGSDTQSVSRRSRGDAGDMDDEDERANEIELVFKPKPSSEPATSTSTTDQSVPDSSSVRFIKTTANATIEHLSKYLSMRVAVENKSQSGDADAEGRTAENEKAEEPADQNRFDIFVAASPEEYVQLPSDVTLEQVYDKYWRVGRPMEMYYAVKASENESLQ